MKFFIDVTREFVQTIVLDVPDGNMEVVNAELAKAKEKLVWDYANLKFEEREDLAETEE